VSVVTAMFSGARVFVMKAVSHATIEYFCRLGAGFPRLGVLYRRISA
jgi:hypothetical protein